MAQNTRGRSGDIGETTAVREDSHNTPVLHKSVLLRV
eukprot:COSAG01_NODE_60710_length_293_cov_0.804124_1_plen_36_part_10